MGDADMSGVDSLLSAINSIEERWNPKAEITYVTGTGVSYAIFVEYGTRPHTITPDDAQALNFSVGGQEVFAKKVEHPGTEPQPFLRSAAEETQRRMDEAVEGANSLDEAVQQVAQLVERIAKRNAPVDTGTLRASIQTQRLGDGSVSFPDESEVSVDDGGG